MTDRKMVERRERLARWLPRMNDFARGGKGSEGAPWVFVQDCADLLTLLDTERAAHAKTREEVDGLKMQLQIALVDRVADDMQRERDTAISERDEARSDAVEMMHLAGNSYHELPDGITDRLRVYRAQRGNGGKR
jgi:hypothetical protein